MPRSLRRNFLGFSILWIAFSLGAQQASPQQPPASPPKPRVGGSASTPSSPSKQSAAGQKSGFDLGAVADGVYRNDAFGFSYKIPFGWVDRTEQMRDDSSGEVLLVVF